MEKLQKNCDVSPPKVFKIKGLTGNISYKMIATIFVNDHHFTLSIITENE